LKAKGKCLGSTPATHGKEGTKTAGLALAGHLVGTALGDLKDQNQEGQI
jgi:hypothetical protein